MAWGGPVACVSDPMVPCGAFEPGEAATNTVVRAQHGAVAAIAMRDPFVLHNTCDGADPTCHVKKRPLLGLSAGSQVMLTTDGHYLIGIDHDDGGVRTYCLETSGEPGPCAPTDGDDRDAIYTYTDPKHGPAQLIIGLRDSDALIVRDHENRLGVYRPKGSRAVRIAPELGDYLRLGAVGERMVAVRVLHSDRSQSVYLVDVDREPGVAHEVGTGDFTSVVFGPGDRTLVLSEGRGADASVLVFDVQSRTLVDAFAGDVISSRSENDHRAIEEVPGLHALSPSGETLAYRTSSGGLAVRTLGTHSSCLVRNTNRLRKSEDAPRSGGDHAVAGFSADGILYAEYDVDGTDGFVYAYDPRHQQLTPLGSDDGGWRLAAVPGRVTDVQGNIERLWAVGVRRGSHASIAEGQVDGQTIGRELIFMPMADDGVWAIDTRDELVDERSIDRALSVRRVAPPRWAEGRLRFDQGSDAQVVSASDERDNEAPMRVPLRGRLCLSTGAPGSWAYRCGDSSGTSVAFSTNSGQQEQASDPNERPEFDPPFPDPAPAPTPAGNGDDDAPSPGGA